MSVLTPFSHALAWIIAAVHSALTALGAAPSAGPTWVLCIAATVVVVRLALLPLAVHGARQARAAAEARPQLQALAKRYRDRRDPESVRRFMEERRRIAADHGLSGWAWLAMLAQVPILFALYRLLTDVAAGSSVGALHAGLVASLGAATLLGVPLAGRGYLGAGFVHFAVVAGLAGVAALLSYVTQRYVVTSATASGDVHDAVLRLQQVMPALSALGLIVAGGVVPVALLVYWLCNSTWTLGQTAALRRWIPAPGAATA